MATKFYVDTQGNDDKAYFNAILFASTLAKNDDSIKRIVLYVHTKGATNWFERMFGAQTTKKLFAGCRIENISVPLKTETVITYSNHYGSNEDIVICCGMDSNDIYKIEDYDYVKYIIAIPWIKSNTQEWIDSRNAVEISAGIIENDEEFPQPSHIAQIAFLDLTGSINMSTGITHPMDNRMAKTYIRALYKYEPSIDGTIIEAYLVSLGWMTSHAQEIKKLIDTLNAGRSFKGGETTGLQKYYKYWESEQKKSK